MKRTASISDYLKPLSEAPTQAYLTNALQLADILEWILAQVGESTIWQTSFSISEEFLRRLYFIEQGGKVKNFHLVLDFKATQKTLNLWVFINKVITNTYLSDNHSKILLVLSEAGDKISVITSQNLTRGNRNESAVISTNPLIFDTLHTQIQNLIHHQSVPLADPLTQRLQ